MRTFDWCLFCFQFCTFCPLFPLNALHFSVSLPLFVDDNSGAYSFSGLNAGEKLWQWQAILLVFSGIVGLVSFLFFLDHCRQQQAALDFVWEELVISGVISHVYNMYSAV